MGKMIHWEFCKKLEFGHNTKCYLNNQQSVLKNKTHKILLDFVILSDHRIPAKRQGLKYI